MAFEARAQRLDQGRAIAVTMGIVLVAGVFISYWAEAAGNPLLTDKLGLEAADGMTRQSWGRYLDRFERRDGAWKVAKRIVVLDSRLTSVAKGALNIAPGSWCARDGSDPLYANRAEVFGGLAGGRA